MTSVFENDQTGQGPEDKQEPQSLFTIGERQYTVEDAQKKIQNADEHISKLEQENAEYRKKVDDYMEELRKLQNSGTESKPEEKGSPQAVDPEEVAKVVREQLKAESTAEAKQANLHQVDVALQQKFGNVEDARQAFIDKAKELGLTPAKLQELSEESPSAVLGWFNTTAQPGPATTTGGHNSNAVGTVGNSVEGSWQWWQNLKKEDPNKYYSPAMTRKRMKDAERMGRDKFFG